MTQWKKRLSRKDASRYLAEVWGITRAPRTLAKLAVTGGGPPFEHLNRQVLYKPESLDEWASGMLRPSAA